MGLSRGMFRLLWSVFFCFLAREHYVFWIFYLARFSLRKSHPAGLTKVWKWRIKNDLRLDCYGTCFSKKLFPPALKIICRLSERMSVYPWLVPRFPHGLCISGHVVRANQWPGRSSRILHRNSLAQEAWEDAVKGQGNVQTMSFEKVDHLKLFEEVLMHGLKIWPWQNQTLYVLKRWKEQMKVICSWCDLWCE